MAPTVNTAAPETITPQLQARMTVQAGCPRTKDVKAASNALYLHGIGKAGGLNIDAAREVVAKHKGFQDAVRFLAHQPYVGPARQPYKKQQRPA